jgi:hypothetical protein
MSPDGKHVVFNSSTRLGPAADLPAGSNRILYEWTDDGANGGAGTLRVVNRTDDASVTLLSGDDASLGGGWSVVGDDGARDEGTRNAISNGADGHSRIYFQNPAPASLGAGGGSLYARVDGNQTFEVSAPAAGHTPSSSPTSTGIRFVDASEDGTRVFFVADGDLTPGAPTTGGLYLYDSAGSLQWLADAPTGAATSGVASSDGSRLYYQSGDDVRLWTSGGTRLVWTGTVGAGVGQTGAGQADFQFYPGFRTVECVSADVSNDGRFFAFVGRANGGGDQQVYRYDADANGGAGQVDHVSTSAFGPAPETYPAAFTAYCQGGYGRMVEKRVMSEDGRYVFFDTGAALVPGDSNGPEVMDAYRWNDGEVELISRGTGPQWSSFQGTDETGANAFFVTQDRLAASDGDAVADLYNARIGGGFAVVPREECEGDACQPPLTPAPLPANPGTEQFSGPGNRPQSAPDEETTPPVLRSISRSALRRFARTGRLTLRVRVGEAGAVQATATARVRGLTARVASARRTARRAGTVRVPLRLSAAARRQLRANGSLRVRITVRFSKSPAAASRTFVLRARRARRARRSRASVQAASFGADAKGPVS